MYKVLLLAATVILSPYAHAQFVFAGEVTDVHGDKLEHVQVLAKQNGNTYRTNLYGQFSFSLAQKTDTLVFVYDGFEKQVLPARAGEKIAIQLHSLPVHYVRKKDFLTSSVKQPQHKIRYWTADNAESYNTLYENTFIKADAAPTLGFAANTNRAAYSNIRRLIRYREGALPPHAVRIEEMLNYFNLAYRHPGGDSTLTCSSLLTTCPWNSQNQLLLLNLSARKINRLQAPPTHLVLAIDVSGSMEMSNKLPLIKAGFTMLIKNLQPHDTVSIISFGAWVRVVAEAVPGHEQKKLIGLINQLQADGPTPGEAAIKLAYQLAQKHFIKNGNNRIILAADGDFNVGQSKEQQLQYLVRQQKNGGVYLSCVGVGTGNYKESKLAIMAQEGNGNFNYIDNEFEAERIMVGTLTQSLFTVADNCHLEISFDGRQIKNYRLIGFDNEMSTLKTDSTAAITGGDMGSGHSVVALIEIERSNSLAPFTDTLAHLRLHWKLPATNLPQQLDIAVSNTVLPFASIAKPMQKAACLAMFGMKLRKSYYAKNISWKLILQTTQQCITATDALDAELMQLMREARHIYNRPRKYNSGY
jgi:Ca-activated chloride channel homolog